MRALINATAAEMLNRGDARSFRFAIWGRAGCDIKREVSVSGHPDNSADAVQDEINLAKRGGSRPHKNSL